MVFCLLAFNILLCLVIKTIFDDILILIDLGDLKWLFALFRLLLKLWISANFVDFVLLDGLGNFRRL